jgi:hypothetical protein
MGFVDNIAQVAHGLPAQKSFDAFHKYFVAIHIHG